MMQNDSNLFEAKPVKMIPSTTSALCCVHLNQSVRRGLFFDNLHFTDCYVFVALRTLVFINTLHRWIVIVKNGFAG